MSAHTPGPWSLDRSEKPAPHKGRYWNAIMANVENEEIGLDGEVIIGEAFTEENAVSEDEAHANARLIAAAPDLLEALRAIEWPCDSEYSRCAICQNMRRDGHAADCFVRMAIAKAEGFE